MSGLNCTITLDGEPLVGCTKFVLVGEAHGVFKIQLELLGTVEFDGDVKDTEDQHENYSH